MNHLDSLFSEIGDDGDDKADDGEHCANIRHPGEDNITWVRWWWFGVDVLRGEMEGKDNETR